MGYESGQANSRATFKTAAMSQAEKIGLQSAVLIFTLRLSPRVGRDPSEGGAGVIGRPARSRSNLHSTREAVPQAPPLTCRSRPRNLSTECPPVGGARCSRGDVGGSWRVSGRRERALSAPPLEPGGGAGGPSGAGAAAALGRAGRGGRAAGAGPRSSPASRSHGRPRLPALPSPRAAPRAPH